MSSSLCSCISCSTDSLRSQIRQRIIVACLCHIEIPFVIMPCTAILIVYFRSMYYCLLNVLSHHCRIHNAFVPTLLSIVEVQWPYFFVQVEKASPLLPSISSSANSVLESCLPSPITQCSFPESPTKAHTTIQTKSQHHYTKRRSVTRDDDIHGWPCPPIRRRSSYRCSERC